MRTIRWLVAGAAALMLTLVPVEMNDGALAVQDAEAAECLVMFEVAIRRSGGFSTSRRARRSTRKCLAWRRRVASSPPPVHS